MLHLTILLEGHRGEARIIRLDYLIVYLLLIRIFLSICSFGRTQEELHL